MNVGSSDLKEVGSVWNERVNSNLVGSEWYIANEVIKTGFIRIAMPADPNGMTKPTLLLLYIFQEYVHMNMNDSRVVKT